MENDIKRRTEKYFQDHSTAILVTGITLCVLGIIGVIDGSFTGFFVTEAFGGLITAAGVMQFFQASKQNDSPQDFSKLILAFFYLITGSVLMFGPLKSAGFIDLVLGIFFLVSGTLKMMIAYGVRSDSGRSWLYSSAGMSLILGLFVIASWPLGTNEGFSISGFLISLELLLTGSSFVTIGYVEKSENRKNKNKIHLVVDKSMDEINDDHDIAA